MKNSTFYDDIISGFDKVTIAQAQGNMAHSFIIGIWGKED
jgi:hypothetical protein